MALPIRKHQNRTQDSAEGLETHDTQDRATLRRFGARDSGDSSLSYDVGDIMSDNGLRIIDELLGIAIGVVIALMLCAAVGHCQTHAIIKNYINIHNPGLPIQVQHQIAREIELQCEYANVPWDVVTAIAKVESCFNPLAVGTSGEIGLMQIHSTKCLGVVIDRSRLTEIPYNITSGICVLLEKIVICKGDLDKAIRRYNGYGPKTEKYYQKVQKAMSDIRGYRVITW